MKLIVGLGNPGISYRLTRHNAGKSFVSSFAAYCGAHEFSLRKSLKASTAQVAIAGQDVVLAWPESYMNLSGEPVRKLVRAYLGKIETDLLVVVDDLALPFGKIRFRPEGSDGGHNGLKSIQEALGTKQFARLRFGIGHPRETAEAKSVEDYVLSRFCAEEKSGLEPLFFKMFKACEFWVQGDMQRVLNSLSDSAKKG